MGLTYIFLGPSLPIAQARRILDANYLPPASQGDIYTVAQSGATAIGLIDGRFLDTPAVWHKEILWAMAHGVHVVGGGSMGALRAAELSSFGMTGVGAIFEAYRDGVLEDDDEVAVIHGDLDSGFQPLSEPMVNIRATLRAATDARILDNLQRQTLEAVAKATYFPFRSYSSLLKEAENVDIPYGVLSRLRDWLQTGAVDQKAVDAMAVLREVATVSTKPAAPVSYAFEFTALFKQLTHSSGSYRIRADTVGRELEPYKIDRWLGRSQTLKDRLYEDAVRRLLAIEESHRQQCEVTEDVLVETIVEFRRRHSLLEAQDVKRWMTENDLDPEGFLNLMEEEARLKGTSELLIPELPSMLRSALRSAGLYNNARNDEVLHVAQQPPESSAKVRTAD